MGDRDPGPAQRRCRDVSGQYVRLSDVTLDWPPATVPPLLVGARGPKTLVLATSPEPLWSRAAIGSPEDVAETVRSFARAGATTVVLQPTAEDPDVAATIELAAAAKTVLRSDSTGA